MIRRRSATKPARPHFPDQPTGRVTRRGRLSRMRSGHVETGQIKRTLLAIRRRRTRTDPHPRKTGQRACHHAPVVQRRADREGHGQNRYPADLDSSDAAALRRHRSIATQSLKNGPGHPGVQNTPVPVPDKQQHHHGCGRRPADFPGRGRTIPHGARDDRLRTPLARTIGQFQQAQGIAQNRGLRRRRHRTTGRVRRQMQQSGRRIKTPVPALDYLRDALAPNVLQHRGQGRRAESPVLTR